MCEFRDQVECRNVCLERCSPKGSCHLDEPTGVTHLFRIALRIVEMECTIHAKQQPQKSTRRVKPNTIINNRYRSIVTVDNDRKKYMSPQLRLICAQGRDYVYIYIMQVQVHASMNPSTTSSVASLGNIGRWAVAPLHKIDVLHLYRWYTHTHTCALAMTAHFTVFLFVLTFFCAFSTFPCFFVFFASLFSCFFASLLLRFSAFPFSFVVPKPKLYNPKKHHT